MSVLSKFSTVPTTEEIWRGEEKTLTRGKCDAYVRMKSRVLLLAIAQSYWAHKIVAKSVLLFLLFNECNAMKANGRLEKRRDNRLFTITHCDLFNPGEKGSLWDARKDERPSVLKKIAWMILSVAWYPQYDTWNYYFFNTTLFPVTIKCSSKAQWLSKYSIRNSRWLIRRLWLQWPTRLQSEGPNEPLEKTFAWLEKIVNRS